MFNSKLKAELEAAHESNRKAGIRIHELKEESREYSFYMIRTVMNLQEKIEALEKQCLDLLDTRADMRSGLWFNGQHIPMYQYNVYGPHAKRITFDA